MNFIASTAIVFCFTYGVVFGASAWRYHGDQGLDAWEKDFPNCGGKSQSPIAIQHDSTVVNKNLGSFKQALFDNPPMSMLIKNTKYSLQSDLLNAYTINDPSLLPGKFKAAQFHFHWAKPGENGSEHTLDGNQYWGELHIVHYNMKYGSLANAVDKADGLAVLGWFVADNYLQDNIAVNHLITPIENNLTNHYKQNTTYSTSFPLNRFLPNNLTIYYRYRGSLTTPTCDETVEWTVFRESVKISRRQAHVFETMLYENEQGEVPSLLHANFRPVQALNGRVVFRSPLSHIDLERATEASLHWIGILAFLISLATLYKRQSLTTFTKISDQIFRR